MMRDHDVAMAVLLEMLMEFGVMNSTDMTYYGKLINLHHDLKRYSQNRIKYNENRSTLTEG